MNTTILHTTKYKNSPLGLIPEVWEVKTLIEVVDKKNKWSFTGGPFGSNLKSEDYTEKGVRIIQLQNIGDGEFLNNYKIYTSIEKANELLSCNIYYGDIILSKMGDPVARGCFIPNIEERYLMASDGIRIVNDKDIIDKVFLLNYINFDIFRSEAVKASTGSTRQRIGLNDLKLLKLPIPPLQEQKAIADCLSTWDKAIEKHAALIAQKELSKKALMQQLLSGKKRLKGFSEEWKEMRLGDLGKVLSGGTPSTTNDDYWDGDINWCTPTDITKLRGEIYIGETVRKITDLGYKNSSTNLLPINSIIVCTRATVGACAINKVPMTTNQGFKSIIPKKINYLFLYYKMLTLKNELLSLASGSTFLEVSKTDFEDIYLKCPSLAEQTAIANVLQCADTEIKLLKNKLTQLKEHKKGLMQVLLTGKKRLKY